VSGATASLPNLQRASNASANAQTGLSGFLGIASALAGGGHDSPLRGISEALGGLDQALQIDVSGLSERLPAALANIEEALPTDALRFVEEIANRYQEVSDFLANSGLVRQIQPGASLETTALALIDELLNLFSARLAGLGSSLIDADTLEAVSKALATMEALASGSVLPADQLLEFLSRNLLGVDADLLVGARSQLDAALAILDPFSATAVEAAVAATRDAATTALRNLAEALREFDPNDLAAYATPEALLDTLGRALEAAFLALEALYSALTVAVARPEWETLFTSWAAVLAAVELADVPTVDDAVDAIAGAIESLLARLTMSLSPDDLAAQVARMAGSLHALFSDSPLAQVRQILIDFIGRIGAELAAIPVEDVRTAVLGMLQTVHRQIEELGIAEVRSTIEKGFQDANDFVDDNLGGDLLAGVSTQLAAALGQLENIPVAELGQELASAIQAASELIEDLQAKLAAGLDEVRTLLASLDGIDFRPVADEVVDEIGALKSRLAGIRPESLSDVERIAIQAGLSVLRAIDLEGMIEGELKKEFASVDAQLAQVVQAILDAWLEFRRRVGTLDGASLAAPVTGLLDEVGNTVLAINGAAIVAPLEKLLDELLAKARTVSPGAILEPLQEPYQRMLRTIERANPDVWVEPLRVLHAEIDRLIKLVDITPLLSTLEQKQRDLFAQARQAIADAVGAVHLPAPLDTFHAQMTTLIVGITDAIFADPDGTLRQVNLSLSASMRPSTLFEPLDQAFDRLLAAIETLPADDVLRALEAIRQGLGAALPAMDPANVVRGMRVAQGRLAALSPSSVAGVVALPELRARLAGRLSLSTANGAAGASLLARFDLTLAPLDLASDTSRLCRLSTAHAALVTALRQRINALDTATAQLEFQRLQSGLGRILPPFLRQPTPLAMADVRAGLATLRPSLKARRIDLAVDGFLRQLAPLQSALDSAVDGFFKEIRQAALALHPGELKDAVADVYASLRARLAVLDPELLAASLRSSVWDPLLDPLRAIDPAALKAHLDALFQNLLAKISGLVKGLLRQLKQAIDAFLVRVRQVLSSVLATLRQKIEAILGEVSKLVVRIDGLLVDDLFKRLLTLLANLQTSFDQELDRVRNEFDGMLEAIPLGASAGVAIA